MTAGTEIERYLRDVLRHIPASDERRASIVADLRAHFEEAVVAGESPSAIIARLGAPAEVAAALAAASDLRYAGFWPRLLAFALDAAIIVAVDVALVGLITVLSNLVAPGFRVAPPSVGGASYLLSLVLVTAVVALALALVGTTFLYFPISEGRFGQTLGKRWRRLAVVSEQGMAIGYKEAFVRRIPFYFRFLLIDALFIFFTKKRQRAFDIVAHTIVIHTGAA